jgi:hypothetical protein
MAEDFGAERSASRRRMRNAKVDDPETTWTPGPRARKSHPTIDGVQVTVPEGNSIMRGDGAGYADPKLCATDMLEAPAPVGFAWSDQGRAGTSGVHHARRRRHAVKTRPTG